TRAPRGRVGWKVAIPQWKPRPGPWVALYITTDTNALARLARLTQRLRSGSDDDLAPLIVAIRQVEALAG
ncbi:MAG: hypothetical protein WB239_18410, partial [Acidimicrobiia bacterium]